MYINVINKKFKIHDVIFISWTCGEFQMLWFYVVIKDTLQSCRGLKKESFKWSVFVLLMLIDLIDFMRLENGSKRIVLVKEQEESKQKKI